MNRAKKVQYNKEQLVHLSRVAQDSVPQHTDTMWGCLAVLATLAAWLVWCFLCY